MNFIIFFGVYLSLESHKRYILEPLGLKVVKKLSGKRWSARHDVVSDLLDGYNHIKSALFQVAENSEQKIETRATAKGLLNKVNNLGFTVLKDF